MGLLAIRNTIFGLLALWWAKLGLHVVASMRGSTSGPLTTFFFLMDPPANRRTLCLARLYLHAQGPN